MKLKSYIFQMALAAVSLGALTVSCEDMLTPESDYVIYDDHLNGASDTATSLVGIIYKLQAIADRTNLLGEVRGDLVTVKSTATMDLQDLANLNVSDDNKYNNPRDYYAIINNCNYFIAKADSNAFDGRGNRIFNKEIAQVKVIRAWTYLQLALNYGRVPFYTEPLLTENEVEAIDLNDRRDLAFICDYFIKDLEPYVNVDFPQMGDIASYRMVNCFFPIDMVLGDLYLWRASLTGNKEQYRTAATHYFNWITNDTRVGGVSKSLYRVRNNIDQSWMKMSGTLTETWAPFRGYSNYTILFSNATNGYNNETFTFIPMDSLAYMGYYSELQQLYCDMNVFGDEGVSRGGYDASKVQVIEPSDALLDLGAAQSYCILDQNKNERVEDFEVDENQVEGLDPRLYMGDLRLFDTWRQSSRDYMSGTGVKQYSSSYIRKFNSSRYVSIYRQTDAFLRLAEALNNGGLPRFAHVILANGLSDAVIRDSVLAFCNETDAAFVNGLWSRVNAGEYYSRTGANTNVSDRSKVQIGIHSRGCGYTEVNPDYAYPIDTLTDARKQEYADLRARYLAEAESIEQDAYAEALIVNEDDPEDAEPAYDYTVFSNYMAEHLSVSLSGVNSFEAYATNRDRLFGLYAKVQTGKAWANDPAHMAEEQLAVDKLLLDEMALETCFEGKRFYDLMRFSMRHDNTWMTDRMSQRSPEVAAKLADRNNWYLSWQGKIGMK